MARSHYSMVRKTFDIIYVTLSSVHQIQMLRMLIFKNNDQRHHIRNHQLYISIVYIKYWKQIIIIHIHIQICRAFFYDNVIFFT